MPVSNTLWPLSICNDLSDRPAGLSRDPYGIGSKDSLPIPNQVVKGALSIFRALSVHEEVTGSCELANMNVRSALPVRL